MDFSFPTQDEICTAYQGGEAEVLELFGQVESTVVTLPKTLQNQVEAIKDSNFIVIKEKYLTLHHYLCEEYFLIFSLLLF